ncbi:leucyl/phenylalanyl-tRNA--protein transferase [Glacieibacterium frigidum]|uniref:Leucyl/phenylalanyl-tRNA--protein transferase n=1 Tax=Glacieibacterium frigidum TaxID=2593303 RepID=A0A552U982_9SPHN|nr:leucyl/phenylalanyl-tRNA--protein transferase [Glacieibacterium frigidum]TRW14770.1 leucyl/phenylalanyl-tRNA--protein transferase [Glacieibacterium frigidum]
MSARLDPDLLLRAYRLGAFPMADSVDAEDVFWVEPKKRGIIPLDGFHCPRSLAKTVRQDRFEVTVDEDFPGVMRACAAAAPDRADSWINATILDAYGALHARGNAHSVECRQDGELVGGLYGVKLGAAFFGESMFSRVRDASKVALVHLVARLRVGGFHLLDTQFLTSHLAGFGAVEVPRAAYRVQLEGALAASGDFFALDSLFAARPETTVSGPTAGKRILQLLTHTS